MARLGMGSRWRCLMANDIDAKKANAYLRNFPPAEEFILSDIRSLSVNHLPGLPLLAWASFPCQDLSLAGARGGIHAQRSGTFWPFWSLMEDRERDSRPIPILVIENVMGLLSSHEGEDFRALLRVLTQAGYRVGALAMDAVYFLPHSRPRLFIVAARMDQIPTRLVTQRPNGVWHSPPLRLAHERLTNDLKSNWLWWRLPKPPKRQNKLVDFIESAPEDALWHSPKTTQRIIEMMSEANLRKLNDARRNGSAIVGTIYKRTRRAIDGESIQRAEVRFDGVSGCLRTPAGGSSRQTLIFVESERVRTRLLSAREAARLMGIPDSYRLPHNYNEAYHLAGDGVAVPVVAWLEQHLLHPLAQAASS